MVVCFYSVLAFILNYSCYIRLNIDVLWEVVRFSIRVIRSICKVEGDVEVVHDF